MANASTKTVTMVLISVIISSLIEYSNAQVLWRYELQDEFMGSTFFDNFWFQTNDYNHQTGAANFTTKDQAQGTGLIRAVDGQPVYIGVEHNKVVGAGGRATVTIVSNKVYTGGLIMGDFQHMPTGCATWPAFWTSGPNWPTAGEIDIVEGVNTNTQDSETLHTSPGCTFNTSVKFSGTVVNTNCNTAVGSGCGMTGPASSFGAPFNSNNGGVFATEWIADKHIKSWFWAASSVPADVTSKQPDPSTWGEPWFFMQFGSNCPGTHFYEHNIIVDIFLCGDWAGNVWTQGCSASTGVSQCVQYVQQTPSAFTEAYWLINSIRVYQWQNYTNDINGNTNTHNSAAPHMTHASAMHTAFALIAAFSISRLIL